MAADRETLREQAFHLFGRAIARSDPGHLEAWVEQGLVRRESDHGDRRLVRHHLSAKGGRTVEELERGTRARMNEVMDRLTTAQLERLVLALSDLTAALA